MVIRGQKLHWTTNVGGIIAGAEQSGIVEHNVAILIYWDNWARQVAVDISLLVDEIIEFIFYYIIFVYYLF